MTCVCGSGEQVLALINTVCEWEGGLMFTPINTMCMLGKVIIAVCGKGRSKQELALIVCVETGDLLKAPINTTCNGIGTLYYWCICVWEGEMCGNGRLIYCNCV